MLFHARIPLGSLPLQSLRASLARSTTAATSTPLPALFSARTYASGKTKRVIKVEDKPEHGHSAKPVSSSSSPSFSNNDNNESIGASGTTQSKDRGGVQLQSYVPRTPGLRHVRRPINDHLWKGRPVKELTYPKRGHGKAGRNKTGRITVRHRGGGHKRRIRTVDFHRLAPGPHTVERIEYDPGRSGHIALVKDSATKKRSYILAVEGLRAGDVVESYRAGIPEGLLKSMGGTVDPGILAAMTARPGNCLPLHLVPVGTTICNIGLQPKGRGQLCRGAGTYGTLMQKEVPLPPRFDEIFARVEAGEALFQDLDGKIQLPDTIPADVLERIKLQAEQRQKQAQQKLQRAGGQVPAEAAEEKVEAQAPSMVESKATAPPQPAGEQQQQQQEEEVAAKQTEAAAQAQTETQTLHVPEQQPEKQPQQQDPQSQAQAPAQQPEPQQTQQQQQQQQPTEDSEKVPQPTTTKTSPNTEPAPTPTTRDNNRKVTVQSLREMRRRSNNVVIRLSSGEVRYIHKDCCCTIGSVSNPDYKYRQVGKAGRSRWLNVRPTVRGVAMNAKDHPHGGGRGKSKGNVHPKSPWGMPAKSGFRTRPKWKVNKAVVVPRVRNQGKRRRGYH